NGSQKDTQIQPNAPVVDVPEVVFDALLHLREFARFAPATVDLCPPGQARLDVMAKGIIRDELFVFTVVRRGMRARTNKVHFARDHVDKLRQLVDARPSKPAAETRDTRIATRRLLDLRAVLQDMHRSEFKDAE